jgi:hypothetical protein
MEKLGYGMETRGKHKEYILRDRLVYKEHKEYRVRQENR